MFVNFSALINMTWLVAYPLTPHREKKFDRIPIANDEAVVLVKTCGAVIFGIHNDPGASNCLCGIARPANRVSEQQLSKTLTLQVRSNRQSPKSSDWNLAGIAFC